MRSLGRQRSNRADIVTRCSTIPKFKSYPDVNVKTLTDDGHVKRRYIVVDGDPRTSSPTPLGSQQSFIIFEASCVAHSKLETLLDCILDFSCGSESPPPQPYPAVLHEYQPGHFATFMCNLIRWKSRCKANAKKSLKAG